MDPRTFVDRDGKWEVREHDRGEEHVLIEPSEEFLSRRESAAAEDEGRRTLWAQGVVDRITAMESWGIDEIRSHLVEQEKARLRYDEAVRVLPSRDGGGGR